MLKNNLVRLRSLFLQFIKIVFKRMAGVLGFGVGLIIVSAMLANVANESLNLVFLEGNSSAQKSIVILPVNGVILGESAVSDMFSFLSEGVVYGGVVRDQLRKLSNDDTVSGIILNVDSPGGTVYGSHMIANAIQQYQEKTKNPVYVYVSGISASGGYLLASEADKIYADQGTLIGSIGVISGPFKHYKDVISEDGGLFFGGVVTQSGVETRYISAGGSKDLGNPYRAMTAEETQQIQSVVDEAYAQFADRVLNARKISKDDLNNKIQAHVFDSAQAKGLGLIDDVLTRFEVYDAILDSIEESRDTIKILEQTSQPSFFGSLFSLKSSYKTNAHPQIICQTAQPLAFYGDLFTLCR